MFYYKGETYKVRTKVFDSHNKLTTPITIKYRIVDPIGTEKVVSTDMSLETTGIYYALYDVPIEGPVGSWKCEVKAKDSSDDYEIEVDTFTVIDL